MLRLHFFSVMRLGKKKEKERETESRREVVDGVSRLLGSAKNQPFKGKLLSCKKVMPYDHIYEVYFPVKL